MVEEVRAYMREMLEAGAIPPSQSHSVMLSCWIEIRMEACAFA